MQQSAFADASTAAEAKVIVEPADGKGMGVYAVDPITKGTWVCSYHGALTTDEEVELRYPKDRSWGGGQYLFRVDDNLCRDAQNSTHFSRFFNHAELGNLEINVTEAEQRIDFIAIRDIAPGEEMSFDYGMAYWRERGQPLGDSRDYSAEAWATRDIEAARLRNRFPLPRGTHIPLTPRTPVEFQATLVMPESESRQALLRALEFFGATRVASTEGDEDGELLDVPYGVDDGASRRTLRIESASVDELADAVVACVASASLNITALSEEHAAGEIVLARAKAKAPNGSALIEWLVEARVGLELIRRWRASLPELATKLRPRAYAAAMSSYLLCRQPEVYGVSLPLTSQRTSQLVQWLETHSDETDELPAVLDVLAALETHAPRARIEALVDQLYSWIRLGEGLVME